MGIDSQAAAIRWASRPMRHMTTREVVDALEDRRKALAVAPNAMASQFIQSAIDKLEAELIGRQERS